MTRDTKRPTVWDAERICREINLGLHSDPLGVAGRFCRRSAEHALLWAHVAPKTLDPRMH